MRIPMTVSLLVALAVLSSGCIEEKPIGGDKDEHGCLIAAGYSWCEAKQKCLRTWEEPCGENVTDFASCVAAGNPVMESYPRQCAHGGQTYTEESCSSGSDVLTLTDAMDIAKASECGDRLATTHLCNEITGTYWIDMTLEKEGCAPACVVHLANRTAEINWRCTGLIPE